MDLLAAMHADAAASASRHRSANFEIVQRGTKSNPIFTDAQLTEMLAAGQRQIDVARRFGVSKAAVCHRVKRLGYRVANS